MVRRLFSSRRKTVKNTLYAFVSSCGGIEDPKGAAMAALEKCGIKSEERPENLDISQFRDLAQQLECLPIGRRDDNRAEIH
jgi:16S rRNA A1518/A1519 N6-dimethyltransferase RsmA/KsgA/DIM1 with predicted DNA glycosylase/AP lyase activity